MKTPLTVAIAAAALTLPSLAQGDRPGRSAADLVIERLSDPSAEKADAALESLVRGGPSSAGVLQEALKRCSDPVFVQRARQALALCEVDAAVFGGLKVGLFADRAEVEPGGKVRFTARLCNVSAEQIVVYTGMSYSGNVFENGLALQRIDDDVETQARFGAVGFCGTGARPLTVKLEPFSFREFHFEATCLEGPGAGQLIPSEERRLVMGFVYLDLGDGQQLSLRLRHSVSLDQVGGMVEPESDPDWQGTVLSNEVKLRFAGIRGG